MSDRFEASIGMVAAALGFGGLGCSVFGPATYSYGTNRLTAGTISLWAQGIGTTPVLLYLAVMAAAALGMGIGAYLHSRGAGTGTLTVLWTSALVLLGGALLTLPGSATAVVPSALHTGTPDSVGIGIYLVLPAVVALVAAGLGTVAPHAPRRPLALRPQ